MVEEHANAVAGAVMAILGLGALWLGWDISKVTEEWLLTAILVVSPVLVWLIPNRKPQIRAP